MNWIKTKAGFLRGDENILGKGLTIGKPLTGYDRFKDLSSGIPDIDLLCKIL